ncbi:MAG: carboxypeptidase-like regulatory domain-containing protein [Dehalococcoidia bacterium]
MNHHLPRITKYIPASLAARLLVIAIISLMVVTIENGGPSVANAQDKRDNILGKVTNGTEGSGLPPDLEVLLMSIDLASNQIIEQESTTVDEDGIFRFDNLISGPGLSYRVVVNADNYTPSVDMATFDNWQNVRMEIYDDTTALDDITISSYVLMVPTIDARSRQAGILTVINVNNVGDRIWIPNIEDPNLTGLDLLRFNLPDGFSDLSIESELPSGNVLQIDTGFAITNPIPPGEAAILISYIIPYEGDSFDFNLKLPYGADQVRMLLPDEAGEITADGLGSPASVVVGESVFNSVEGDNFAVDEVINIHFSGLPQPTPLQSLSEFFQGRTYVIVFIWIVGVALLAILGYALYSSRKKSNLRSDDDDDVASRGDVIAEIAALDDEYEANKIDEDEYKDRRDELKQLVFELNGDTSSDEDDQEDTDESEKYVYNPEESEK